MYVYIYTYSWRIVHMAIAVDMVVDMVVVADCN